MLTQKTSTKKPCRIPSLTCGETCFGEHGQGCHVGHVEYKDPFVIDSNGYPIAGPPAIFLVA